MILRCRRLFLSKNILGTTFLFDKSRTAYCTFYVFRKNILFFRNEKTNVIKNEIDEIFKNELEINEKDPLNKDSIVQGEKKKEEIHEDSKEDSRFQRNKGKLKRLFLFISFQTIPIIGLMYLFKYLEDVKLAELNFSFESSDDIINEVIKLLEDCSKCFCLYFDKKEIQTIFIQPLNYENAEVNYESLDTEFPLNNSLTNDTTTLEQQNEIEPKEENNTLKNVLFSLNKPLMQKLLSKRSTSELPLNYVYFCISKNSDIHKYLEKQKNELTLLYTDDKKNLYATLKGYGSIIEDEEVKNIMWDDKWSYLIAGNSKENYILVKFTPYTISLKTIGLKNEHWKNNIVKRSMDNDTLSWVKI